MRNLLFIQVILIICILQLFACNSSSQKDNRSDIDTVAIRKSIASAPVLTPQESIKKMQLEDGFEIKLVAAEPARLYARYYWHRRRKTDR